jgi:hypothetical protein
MPEIIPATTGDEAILWYFENDVAHAVLWQIADNHHKEKKISYSGTF